MAVAIDSSFACNGKAVNAVNVYKCAEIIKRLPLHSRGLDGEMLYSVGAFEHCSAHEMKMCALPEEQRAAEERTFRHDNDASALPCRNVDNTLNGFRLYHRTVVSHPIVGKYELLSQRIDIYFCRIGKPSVYRRTVGPGLRLCLIRNQRHEKQRQHYPHRPAHPHHPLITLPTH